MKRCLNVGAIFLLHAVLNLAALDCRAGNVSLDFNGDISGSPPQGVYSSGVASPDAYVRVEQDGLRSTGDLSVVFRWASTSKAPKLAVASEQTPFPSEGSLLLDVIVRKHGGPFHIVGKSSKGRTLFHFFVNRAGQGVVRTPDGDTVVNDFIIGQWYLQRFDYNFDTGVYSTILDNYFSSGDVRSNKLENGETFAEVLFYGEEGGPSLYGLDSIRLVAREHSSSQSRKADLPFGTLRRAICWDTVLAPSDPLQRAIIVYPSAMKGGAELAITLRDAVKEKTGRELPCLSDQVVTSEATWLVREKYLRTPMIVLGNAVDNRVLYAVATKFLAMSNRRWPGGDRYCNRAVLEPFRSDVNLILLEASTLEGLTAAVGAFRARLQSLESEDLSLPYFRKLGASDGEWKEKHFKRKGLDLSGSIDEIKEQIIKKHGKSAPIRGGGLYFYPIWNWLSGSSIEAAKYAAAVLMFQQDRLGEERLGGHYNFDRTFKAWQLCFTSGVLNEKEINRIESIMAKAAADPRDYYAYGFRYHNGKRACRGANRHTQSSLSNYLCCPDYVLSHCRLNSITKETVESYDQAYRRVAIRFTDSFRDNNDTSEVADATVAMINLMALTGNLSYVRDGTLADAAAVVVSLVNNLGHYTAQSPYIGNGMTNVPPGKSVLGAAAFYSRDAEFQWLYKHLKLAACRTSHENPIFNDLIPEEYPKRFLGVTALPFDKRIYRTFETPDLLPWRGPNCEPSGIPCERLFDNAVFRDGFKPDEAFLMLMSTQLTNNHSLNHSNAIIQYTDLGKILLYTSSCLVEKWARNVATASNGLPSKATFACVKKAMVNSGDVSAISSVNPYSGNTEWTRTVVHHRGHFFVVMDQMEAQAEDDYAFTTRWRTYYPQTLEADGVCRVDAGDGVEMRIIGAEDGLQHDSDRAEADGSTSPYMYVQRKSATMKKGETVTFKNLFYASSPDRPDTCDVREVDTNSVIVKGVGKGWEELALIGVNRGPKQLGALRIDADIFYVNRERIVAANCRKIELSGARLFSSAAGENADVSLEGKELDLKGLFAASKKPSIAAVRAPSNRGVEELWAFDDFAFPDEELKIRSASSSRPSISKPTGFLNDDMNRLRVIKPRHGASWGSDKPLEIVLDLGAIVDIKDIRLYSVVAKGYYRRFYYEPDDVTFKVVYSDDGFKTDLRERVPEVKYTDFTFPRAHYTYAGRVPVFVIPAGLSARYVKIIPETTRELIAFQKIRVFGQEKRRKVACDLRSVDLDGDGDGELVALTSNSELVVLSDEGRKLWSKHYDGTVTTWRIVDLENDGKKEILLYTTREMLYAMDHDGGERLSVDMEAYSKTAEPEKWDRWYNVRCFKHVNAWDPDGDGVKEIFGFGHTNQTVIKADGSIVAGKPTGAYKPEETIVNSSVLGKKILAGMSYDLRLLDENYKNIKSIGLPAKSSGNNQMPGLARIFALDAPGAKGFLVVNPVAIMSVSATDLKERWSEFLKVPITCCSLHDVDGDGADDLVVGCKDGFVRIYDVTDGGVSGKVLTGPLPVVDLSILGNGGIAVATKKGVSLYDRGLKNTGYLSVNADRIAPDSSGGSGVVFVSDRQGVIRALRGQ